jgi:hypothetical protein
MDFSLESLGGFAKDVASATATAKNAFKEDEPADRKEAKAKGMMNWQTIGLALGGVLAVALILKIAFRK